MKIVFFGTNEFGIPLLETMARDHSLLAVVTQPDRAIGRKQTLSPTAVKVWALKQNIEAFAPHKPIEIIDNLQQLAPDLAIVASYGHIIPKAILTIPIHGAINIHASLLPRYRGATPIQTALHEGEAETGLTVIQMDEKMDHGPILARKKIPIDPADDYTALVKKLSLAAVDLIRDLLPKIAQGTVTSEIQNEQDATYTKLLTRADGRINWQSSAAKIHNQTRALNPEPGCWTTLNDRIVNIVKTSIATENKIELPGKIYRDGKTLLVKCGDASVAIEILQMEGRTVMTGEAFLNGINQIENKIFI